jgi:hypothetical protein
MPPRVARGGRAHDPYDRRHRVWRAYSVNVVARRVQVTAAGCASKSARASTRRPGEAGGTIAVHPGLGDLTVTGLASSAVGKLPGCRRPS